MDDEDEREYKEIESVANEGRVVMYLGPGEGTGPEGTEAGVLVKGRVYVRGGGIAHGDRK